MGKLLIQLCRLVPVVARRVLRAYLRSGLPVSADAAWIVFELKRQLIPTNNIRCVPIGDGQRMHVDLETAVGREIYYHGTYEPDVASFIKAVVPEGGVVIDGGANIGELTLRAARQAGRSGRVLAIEASPETASTLRSNLKLNGLEHAEVVEAALTKTDSTLEFFFGEGKHSLSSSLTTPSDFVGRKVEVRGLSLGTLVKAHGLERIDLIKLDVEGAELDVFIGGEAVLKSFRPMIVFEYNKRVADRAGWGIPDVLNVVDPWGFELYHVGPNGIGCRFESSEIEGFDDTTKIDLIVA